LLLFGDGQSILPLLPDSISKICVNKCRAHTYKSAALCVCSCYFALAIAVYWRPSYGAEHVLVTEGKTVVPAIVILIILAASGGAWLGFRAGYRRGWLARDVRDAHGEEA